MKQLLSRVSEVLAEVVVYAKAALLHLGVEDLLGERATATAARRRLSLLLQRAQRGAAGFDGLNDFFFRHAVAGAHECRIGQEVDAEALCGPLTQWKNQILRVLGKRQRVEHHL